MQEFGSAIAAHVVSCDVMLPLSDFVSFFSLSRPPLLRFFVLSSFILLYYRYAANIWTQLIRAYGRRSDRTRPTIYIYIYIYSIESTARLQWKSFSRNLNFMFDACLNSRTHCSCGEVRLYSLETTIYIRFALFRLENRIIVTKRFRM